MDPNNPLLATQTITLKDGIPRTFCWDFGAHILLEDATRSDKAKCYNTFNSARVLRNLIWAGLSADATDRGEDWTLRKVETLIPTSPEEMGKLHIQVNALIEQASPQGKTQPDVAGARRVPAQGHGIGKRRKR